MTDMDRLATAQPEEVYADTEVPTSKKLVGTDIEDDELPF